MCHTQSRSFFSRGSSLSEVGGTVVRVSASRNDPCLGDLAELIGRDLVPIEQRLEERAARDDGASALHARRPGRSGRSGGRPAPPPSAAERRLLEGAMTERMRRWFDDPHPQLDGRTPREAARGERRAEVVRLMRGIENGAERARRDGEPHADVSWIGDELGIADELAA